MIFTTIKNGLFGALLGVAVWIAVTSPDARAQEDAKDWPMYNRDVVGTRFNAGETAIDRSNAAQLQEKWRFPAKGSSLTIVRPDQLERLTA